MLVWLAERFAVNPAKHRLRPIGSAIRIHNRDAIFAKARSDSRAFAIVQVFEIQIAHDSGGMEDGGRDPRFLGGRISFRHGVAGFTEEFHPAHRHQACDDTIHTVTDVGRGTIGAFYIPGEMVVARARAAVFAPPTEAAVLLVTFHLAVRSDDFVALIDVALKVVGAPGVRRRDRRPT